MPSIGNFVKTYRLLQGRRSASPVAAPKGRETRPLQLSKKDLHLDEKTVGFLILLSLHKDSWKLLH